MHGSKWSTPSHYYYNECFISWFVLFLLSSHCVKKPVLYKHDHHIKRRTPKVNIIDFIRVSNFCVNIRGNNFNWRSSSLRIVKYITLYITPYNQETRFFLWISFFWIKLPKVLINQLPGDYVCRLLSSRLHTTDPRGTRSSMVNGAGPVWIPRQNSDPEVPYPFPQFPVHPSFALSDG